MKNKYTDRLLSYFPSDLGFVKNERDPLHIVINTGGVILSELDRELRRNVGQMNIDTCDPLLPSGVFYIQPSNVAHIHLEPSGVSDMVICDDNISFLSMDITGFEYRYSFLPSGIPTPLIGIAYGYDMEKENYYITSSGVFDIFVTNSSEILSRIDVSEETQSFEARGFDEYLNIQEEIAASGIPSLNIVAGDTIKYALLQNEPVGPVKIIDVLNLQQPNNPDSDGIVVNPNDYVVIGRKIIFAPVRSDYVPAMKVNQYGFDQYVYPPDYQPDIGFSSSYIAEYKFRRGTFPTYLCTQRMTGDVGRCGDLHISNLRSMARWIDIPFRTIAPNVLSVEYQHLRPSSKVIVKCDYAAKLTWNWDSSSDFAQDIAGVVTSRSVKVGGVNIDTVSINFENGISHVTIPAINQGTILVEIFAYRSARLTVTAIPALSKDGAPYANEYTVYHGRYIPRTIVEFTPPVDAEKILQVTLYSMNVSSGICLWNDSILQLRDDGLYMYRGTYEYVLRRGKQHIYAPLDCTIPHIRIENGRKVVEIDSQEWQEGYSSVYGITPYQDKILMMTNKGLVIFDGYFNLCEPMKIYENIKGTDLTINDRDCLVVANADKLDVYHIRHNFIFVSPEENRIYFREMSPYVMIYGG